MKPCIRRFRISLSSIRGWFSFGEVRRGLNFALHNQLRKINVGTALRAWE